MLILLTIAQASGQWERNILIPAFNYPSSDPRYSITEIITTSTEFASVSGLYFNLPLVIFSLAAGLITEKFSRRLLVTISTAGLAICVLGMGLSQHYY